MHKITLQINEPQAKHLIINGNRYRMTAESYIRKLINKDMKIKFKELEKSKKNKNGKK